jgi:UDP-N-acetylmuramoylalanine--D-glutamate ligase
MTMTLNPLADTPTIDPDRLRLEWIRAGGLRNVPITVLGLARSGIALTRFLVDAGAAVTVYDGRPEDDLRRSIEALEGRPVRLVLGPEADPAAAWVDAALIATSPSINPAYPTTEPRLRAALGTVVERRWAGDPTAPAVVSEPDLFLRLCPSPTIGITGTKGKTTTAALTHALLAADPEHPAILGGNMGVPIVERLFELTPRHRVVYELSELQLPTLSRGTTVAVYTNVTSDHLDRHGSLEAYRRVKRRLAELVDPSGLLVLNAEDPVVAAYAEGAKAQVVRYRRDQPGLGEVGIVDGWITVAGVPRLGSEVPTREVTGPVMPITEIAIPGEHNVANALAAVAVAAAFGVPLEAIRAAASGFRGVEHRLETVAVVDGVRYVNDSQGTQPDAVVAALRAFEPPIVLIAGGRDKGVDLSALGPVVADRAAAAVLIGESAAALESLFGGAGLRQIERAASLEQAVERAAALAEKAREAGGAVEATVLLSPAAASFDMFDDYEARGRAFKAAVRDLAERAARRGGTP